MITIQQSELYQKLQIELKERQEDDFISKPVNQDELLIIDYQMRLSFHHRIVKLS